MNAEAVIAAVKALVHDPLANYLSALAKDVVPAKAAQ
jgi:hypothetical protein